MRKPSSVSWLLRSGFGLGIHFRMIWIITVKLAKEMHSNHDKRSITHIDVERGKCCRKY